MKSKSRTMGLVLGVLFVAAASLGEARVSIVATGPDLGALAREIGGAEAEVDVLARGTQDLHHLETKPSYMSRMSRADLLISNGLALEIGWLPSVIRGARNPKINPGARGHLELGAVIDPIEVPSGRLSRADGDVHPEGNPHWTLDPARVAKAALVLGERLAELDDANAVKYRERAKALSTRLMDLVDVNKSNSWAERINKTGIDQVVTYHKTLAYFAERFGLRIVGYLEPKPGIPPSAQHTIGLIKLMKEKNVRLVLVEHFYDTKSAERVSGELPRAKVLSIPVAVGARDDIKSIDDLYEAMVRTIEAAK